MGYHPTKEDFYGKRYDFGQPVKTDFLVSIPVLLGNIFQQFYNMADAIIVGRLLGEDALAAVGATGSIMFLVLYFATVLHRALCYDCTG